MKHLKEFNTEQAYNAVKTGLDLPNISITQDDGHVHANPERGLYFQFATSGTITVTIPAAITAAFLEYIEWSIDKGETWNNVENTSSAVTVTTTSAQEVWIRGKGTALSDGEHNTTITASASCIVGGNIMSLLYGDTNFNELNVFPNNSTYNFQGLFASAANITSAKLLVLPVTTLTDGCYAFMFNGCTGLLNGPELPATTLGDSCYAFMFRRCTHLVYAPVLPATTLADSCYEGMFGGCSALAVAPNLPALTATDSCYSYMLSGTAIKFVPELPATILAANCYEFMFGDCTALENVPKLPATTMVAGCYNSMFKGCTGIETAPVLPATTLDDECYASMFEGCTSLKKAPALPATTLAANCYDSMFKGCTSLVEAPDLPALTLVSGCYCSLFDGCTSINKINAAFTTTPSETYTDCWVDGVAATGTFIKNINASWSLSGISGVPTGWTVEPVSPLCFTATEAGTFTLTVPSGIPTTYLQSVAYSTDGWNWTARHNDGTGFTLTTPSIAAGSKVWWKAIGNGTSYDGNREDRSSTFSSTAGFTISGNLYSMCGDLTNTLTSLAGNSASFAWLFKNCTHLSSVSGFTMCATTLASACYTGMFFGCTSLTNAPSLPATVMTGSCYAYMFSGCTALAAAPTLSSTSLNEGCYACMFQGCTALTGIPTLSATTMMPFAYKSMFKGCTGLTGTINLPATHLDNSCYSEMLAGCTHITRVNILGTNFDGNCCFKMMYGCSAVATIQCRSLKMPSGRFTQDWVYGVAASGTYIKNSGLVLNPPRGITWVPENWTITTG